MKCKSLNAQKFLLLYKYGGRAQVRPRARNVEIPVINLRKCTAVLVAKKVLASLYEAAAFEMRDCASTVFNAERANPA